MDELLKKWAEWLHALDSAGSISRGKGYRMKAAQTYTQWASLMVKARYTNEQASVAWLWVTAGNWFDTKHELQYADLYPDEKRLQSLKPLVVSLNYHQGVIKRTKEAHDRELHNVALHYERKFANNAQERDALLEFGRETLRLREVIAERDDTILTLCKEIERLRRQLPVQNEFSNADNTIQPRFHSAELCQNEPITTNNYPV